jgi:hypothetical protein
METFKHTIYELLPIAAVISAWAYVWVHELTAGDGIFGWLSMWIDKALPWWISKPIVGCEACHAGQVAMWTCWCYLYPNKQWVNIPILFSFIAITILFTVILTAWITKLKQ